MKRIAIGALMCALMASPAWAKRRPPPPRDKPADHQDKRPDDRHGHDDHKPGDRHDDDRKPGDNRPGDNRPGDNRPGDNRPGADNRPGDNRPGDNRPGDNRPGDNRPGDNRPGSNLPRRVWKLERPTVSSYWPAKGEPGARVVIRGRNFARTTEVTWGGTRIAGAKVSADEISFTIPARAVSGTIALRGGGLLRPVVVGAFEVTKYDAAAEAKRLEDERRKAAEAAWTARQSQLAKDRAARDAAIAAREAAMRDSRDQRRRDRQAEIAARWRVDFLSDEETQDELALHAQRLATIERMRLLADARADGKIAVRIDIAFARESDRHDARMKALEANFQGGAR